MELVALLQVLWRRRFVVIAGVVLAAAGGVLSLRGATTHSGVATVRLVLDTPQSQTVDVKPDGADTLTWRAGLFADLIASRPLMRDIAGRMGIRETDLAVTIRPLSVAPIPVPLPRISLEAAAAPTEAHRILVDALVEVPIIVIDTEAPTRDKAAKLADAAAAAVIAAAQAPGTGEDYQQLAVDRAGPVRSLAVVNGPRRVMAAATTVMLFILWCTCVAAVEGIRRRRRLNRLPDWLFEPLSEPVETVVSPLGARASADARCDDVDANQHEPARERARQPRPRRRTRPAWDQAPAVLPLTGIDSRRRVAPGRADRVAEGDPAAD